MTDSLHDRMLQVEKWLGVVATRPLQECDYERARTRPRGLKRAVDGLTYGAGYMVRHSRRNLEKDNVIRGLALAVPVPLMALAMIVVPVSICFGVRQQQSRFRSDEATRENSIAFEFQNARRVARILAHDDQVKMLKTVHGITRRDVVARACACIALGAKYCVIPKKLSNA